MIHTPNVFSGLDLSNLHDGEQLIERYGMWFERYPEYAKKSLTQRLSNEKNALGAWFELLLHELLFQLGCNVDVKDIDNPKRTPDYLASHGDRGCYVEATTVNPQDNPSSVDPNLQDALRILNSLSSSAFQMRLIVEGTIARTLSKGELVAKFGKLLTNHDPDAVKRQVQEFGEECAPYDEIRGKDWSLRGELVPISSGQLEGKESRDLIIGPLMGTYMGDASFEVQKRVSKKAGRYRLLDAPLIVAANVVDIRFDREAERAALFGPEQIRYFPNNPEIPDQLIRKPAGVWVEGGHKPRYTRLAGVIMFDGFYPRDPRGSVCLYVNPFIDEPELPKPLYRLPHAKGEYGHIRCDGIDIETLLAT